MWIGEQVIISYGCKRSGNLVVIGAGSVVTHDVESYTVVAGNLARVIRKRFSDATIQKIEKSRWWEKEPNEINRIVDC